MTNKDDHLADESSENSTSTERGQLVPASPLTLEAVRSLAESALKAGTWAESLAFIHEQVEMLNRLIERSQSEEETIYEWASGQ